MEKNSKNDASDTSKIYKLHSSNANGNYSGSIWVGLGRVGWGRSNSDYKAISASQKSWSLCLAELGNYSLTNFFQTRIINDFSHHYIKCT